MKSIVALSLLTASVVRAGSSPLKSAAAATQLTLTGDEVWVVSANEGSAIKAAVRNVNLDAYNVLGVAPVIVNSPPARGSLPNSTILVYFGTTAGSPWLTGFQLPGTCVSGWEAHCVLAFPPTAAGTNGYSTIVATGSGLRGGIYGAYTFAEEILGINPWAAFTDDFPAYAGPGGVSLNSSISIVIPPPAFRYRGIFINDEDLLSNRWPEQLARASMSLHVYEEIIETLLRLKGNTLLPATNPFADEDVYALGAARGLVLTHHHYDLLGGNVFAWPLNTIDWDWTKDPGTMANLWRSSITAQADLPEVLWSVGLRGLNDYSYPCSSDQECGLLISQAIANQTAWVRAIAGPNATLITYLWDEALAYLTEGYLIIPEGVLVLFTDAGAGYIRVDGNFSTYADGVYYHTAMYSGAGNQLSEVVPADRIFAQMTAVVKGAKSTNVILDNVSDMKPCPMTTEAVLRFAWDPTPFMGAAPNATAMTFYATWGATQLHLPDGSNWTCCTDVCRHLA
jgi:hypothetical protein